MNIAILYHQVKPGVDCPDGIASAFVAHWFLSDPNEETKIIGCVYQEEPPDLTDADRIYVVDFSFPKAVIDNWLAAGKSVVVIDHHKTAQEHLGDVSTFSKAFQAVFDLNECGATLVWRYFEPNIPAPPFLRYIRDRDLWNFDLEYSEEIHEAIANTRYRIANSSNDRYFLLFIYYDLLIRMTKQELIERYAEYGAQLLAPKREKIANAAARYQMIQLPDPRPVDFAIPVVETRSDEDRLVSDICAKLYRDLCPDAPFVACITSDGKWSLRSNKHDSNYDVSAIAKHYSGGGHHNAAGFSPAVDRNDDIPF